jgi:hypothetical protein
MDKSETQSRDADKHDNFTRAGTEDATFAVAELEVHMDTVLERAAQTTFGRREPDKVVRMRAAGARPKKSLKHVLLDVEGVDMLGMAVQLRELLREIFYLYAPTGKPAAFSARWQIRVLSRMQVILHAGTICRGAFLVLAKQASLLDGSHAGPAVDQAFRCAIGSSHRNRTEAPALLAGFPEFCSALNALAKSQVAEGTDAHPLSSLSEKHLQNLLQRNHAGQVPAPCRGMLADSYVDACTGPFRARLKQAFKHLTGPVVGSVVPLLSRCGHERLPRHYSILDLERHGIKRCAHAYMHGWPGAHA